jgi:acyl transferase domain-containing protein/NADPH:quinone reductase-like Zn-dependent oxidoreductase/acyl carrier protein
LLIAFYNSQEREKFMTSTTENQFEDNLIQQLIQEKFEPIAIVGLSLRFPGNLNNADSFLQMLKNGQDGIEPIPLSRWDNKKYYSEVANIPGKISTHSGGYIQEFDQFDPKFFSISPKEANNMDPQQRVMLELAWEALEQANINPETLRGTNGSVYIGASTVDYVKETTEIESDCLLNYMGTGIANSAISGRISYFLGLRGPCLSIDTACSSSLVALHLAINGLRNKESNLALCGSVNIIHHPYSHIIFSLANMLAPDGRCKTFDESADGYGRSEGAGIVVLKRLSDAIKDKNTIHCIIRGSSVLQDGESGGLTVPNGAAQEIVMKQAIANSMLEPADISYVEAHGTGTPLGDPIEIQAIDQVFGNSFNKTCPLYVGSVKTNLGHMEAAAGMGGLIKVILQLKNKEIYPHLNMKNPSKHIPWNSISLQVPQQVLPWKNGKKRALINSFGFTGTIASLIIEETPEIEYGMSSQKNTPYCFTLSAKNYHSLQQLVNRYLHMLPNYPDSEIANLCYTSNQGRAHFSCRLSALIKNKSDLISFLETKQKELAETNLLTKNNPSQDYKVAFLFPGQGSQYPRMGKKLYEHYSIYRNALDKCDQLFSKYLDLSIKDVILSDSKSNEDALNQTLYTQPALFSIEFALAQLWLSFGIKPSILIGHSIGEIVAATIAQLFSLEDAILLVATRARLMQSVKKAGSMLAVQASRDYLQNYLTKESNWSFAAINSPNQCVISGDKEELDALCNIFSTEGMSFKQLSVSHAFHSNHMEEIFDEFRQDLKVIQFKEPVITFISNTTGLPASIEEVMDLEYWIQHIRNPVNFAKGISSIEERGQHIFLELGPNPVLISLAKQNVKSNEHLWAFSLKENSDDLSNIHQALLAFYQTKFKLDWPNIHLGSNLPMVNLPLYAFERKRYWIANNKKTHSFANHHPLLGERKFSENEGWEFVAEIRSNSPNYLADHVVMDKILFPGAGYMEIVLALQDAVFGKTNFLINDFYINKPLFLDDAIAVTLVTRLIKTEIDHYKFEISSFETNKPEETRCLHVKGRLEQANPEFMLNLFDHFPESAKDIKSETLNNKEIYELLSSKGLQYGSLFRKVEATETTSEHTVKGKISNTGVKSQEFLNPPIFDAVLHTIAAVSAISNSEKTYIPVGFESVLFLKKPKNRLESKVILNPASDSSTDQLTANLLLLDEGEPVFIAKNLKMKAIPNQVKKAELKLGYTPKWIAANLNASEMRDYKTIWISPSEVCNAPASFQDNITLVNSIEKVDACLKTNADYKSIVYFWNTSNSAEPMKDICESNYNNILKLINLLDDDYFSRDIKLILVTTGAEIFATDKLETIKQANILQSSLWGFCTVLNNEHQKYKSRIVDFDPAVESSISNYEQLIKELLNNENNGEFQIAYRQNKRFVRRLTSLHSRLDEENFKLEISELGTFSAIQKQKIPVEQPQANQILVKVHSAGINFKDILNALGLLKKYAEDSGLNYSPLPLGFECSGIVIEAGEDSEFSPGDEVIVSHLGCMQRYITVSSESAVLKPKNISFEEAAGIATAYITSYYALHHLAKIKSGEKILIHAAAGGVGQAAIQLAKRFDMEIYASASHAKWNFLKQQGVHHIMSSRDLEFEKIILQSTNRKGVDVVLNSLNKEFIPAGLNSLAQKGRFIEIGKIDVWDRNRVSHLRDDIEYHQFDLSELPEQELHPLNKNILKQIVSYLENEEIKPLPTTIYGLHQLEEAFSALSRGNNIGKLVLSFDEEEAPGNTQQFSIKADHSYLITGGFGALGLHAAKWLYNKGAKKIFLLGRSALTPERLVELAEEIHCPNEVLIGLQGDVSNKFDMQRIFNQIKDDFQFPLGGIIHTAGVLEDCPISVQNWTSINKVFEPKIYGTWYLHEQALLLKNLDFFISYSSISSLTGTLGQSNYAAANAYIDSLMKWRSHAGLPGLSINWGPWATVGMAANLSQYLIKNIEEKGVKFINPQLAMETLSKVVATPVSQAVIGEFDWSKYHQSLPGENLFYSKVAIKGHKTEDLIDIQFLNKAPKNERFSCIQQIIRSKIAVILHFDQESEIDLEAKFSDLGMDSLVSVEFKNILEKVFKVTLATSVIFDYPSLPSISDHILNKIFAKDENNPSKTKKQEILNKFNFMNIIKKVKTH